MINLLSVESYAKLVRAPASIPFCPECRNSCSRNVASSFLKDRIHRGWSASHRHGDAVV